MNLIRKKVPGNNWRCYFLSKQNPFYNFQCGQILSDFLMKRITKFWCSLIINALDDAECQI